ncbi:acyl-CoA dehydrogenase family protein [Paraburkholderia guartelaensis]|uniref:Acyl-CoA dehydrogenase family protein n=1 Tax=Paraburkholderia guartelaensis TaxID=2546446 RepID=A0ABU9SIJ1_9BURK
MSTTAEESKTAPKQFPPPNSDFYHFAETLNEDERAVLQRIRTFMESNVAPIIYKYWVEDAFPFAVIPGFKELGIGGLGIEGYGCVGGSQLLFGLTMMELARVDASIATFFGVHTGLAMGSIEIAGSQPGFSTARSGGSATRRGATSRSSGLITMKDCRVPEANRLAP